MAEPGAQRLAIAAWSREWAPCRAIGHEYPGAAGAPCPLSGLAVPEIRWRGAPRAQGVLPAAELVGGRSAIAASSRPCQANGNEYLGAVAASCRLAGFVVPEIREIGAPPGVAARVFRQQA
jgi:hypothetical protein